MRILWLSHSGVLGGAELALAEGVDALSARGHEVHVVLPEEGPLRKRLDQAASLHVCRQHRWASVTVPSPPERLRWRLATLQKASTSSREMAAIIRGIGAEIVVTNTSTIANGAIAARRARVPHVWFLHEFGHEDHGYRFLFGRRASLGLMRQSADLVLVNSAALHTYFARIFPHARLQTVRYAVETPDLQSEPPGKTLRLVLVGRRMPSKGQQDAVAAIALLASEGLDVYLELIGHGTADFDQELRRSASEILDRVHFVDPYDGHFARVAKADVALMCSRREALGRVTIEAMKLAKPVVGTATGATPELIRHGWNGFLYSPGDFVDLASWIERLYRDRGAAREMGHRGQAWALERFNLESYAEQLEASFRRVLNSRRHRAYATGT
jgi:glycosyltransferase involved in cell wall biosynthesis